MSICEEVEEGIEKKGIVALNRDDRVKLAVEVVEVVMSGRGRYMKPPVLFETLKEHYLLDGRVESDLREYMNKKLPEKSPYANTF